MFDFLHHLISKLLKHLPYHPNESTVAILD